MVLPHDHLEGPFFVLIVLGRNADASPWNRAFAAPKDLVALGSTTRCFGGHHCVSAIWQSDCSGVSRLWRVRRTRRTGVLAMWRCSVLTEGQPALRGWSRPVRVGRSWRTCPD